MIKNKLGWIRIVEAFTMILVITGVFLVITGKQFFEDSSEEIHEKEQGILRGIQLNNSLRESILDFNVNNLPIEWENFPENLKEEITSKTPNYMECESKICKPSEDCIQPESVVKSIYTQEVIISSSLETYSPRKLKLFCWRK